MEPLPKQGCRRIAREDCRIGDWVEATSIPDWSQEVAAHVFRRERVSISPESGTLGGLLLSSKPQEWNFVASYRDDQLVWVRSN